MSQPYPPLLTPPHCATPPPLLSSRVNEKSDFNVYEDIESKPHVWTEPVVEKPDWDGNTMGRFLDFLHTGDYRPHAPSSELEIFSSESGGVLLVHAKLYLLARYKNLTTLQSLALRRLKTALDLISIFERTAKTVIELLQYIHSRTGPKEPARELVVGYVARNFRALKAVSGREMRLLLCGGGDLAVELMHKMVTRQFGSESGFGTECGNLVTLIERVEERSRRIGDIESDVKKLHVVEVAQLDTPSTKALVAVVDKADETSEDFEGPTSALTACYMVNKEFPVPENEAVEDYAEDTENIRVSVQGGLVDSPAEDKKGSIIVSDRSEASSEGAEGVESEVMGDLPDISECLVSVADRAVAEIKDIEGEEVEEDEARAGLEVGKEDSVTESVDRAELEPENAGGIKGAEDEVDVPVVKIPQLDIPRVAEQVHVVVGGPTLSRRLYISLQAWCGLRPPAEASWRLR